MTFDKCGRYVRFNYRGNKYHSIVYKNDINVEYVKIDTLLILLSILEYEVLCQFSEKGWCLFCGKENEHGKKLCHYNQPNLLPKQILIKKEKKEKKNYFENVFPELIYETENGKQINCHYCDKPFKLTSITKDHKIPVSKGGGNEKENIVPACRKCNGDKSNMEYEIFVDKIKNKL